MSSLKISSQSFISQCDKTIQEQFKIHSAKQAHCCSLALFKNNMNNSNTFINKEKIRSSNNSFDNYIKFFSNVNNSIKKLSIFNIQEDENLKRLKIEQNEVEIEKMSDCFAQINRNKPLRNPYYYNPLAPLPS